MLQDTRSFNDVAVPRDAHGQPLRKVRTSDEYRFYVAWLAEHLWDNPAILSRRQEELVLEYKDVPSGKLAFDLAESLGYNISNCGILEMFARNGDSFERVEAAEREELERYGPDAYTEPFEEWKTKPEEYEQIRLEVAEMDAIPDCPAHADIGVRALLSWDIRRCKDIFEAKRIIESFYRSFNNAVSK